MKKDRRLPIFALNALADWDDIENALEASVQYQTSHRGQFGPMFAFAPMTEPANPDRWEPLATSPQNLLIASIERKEDARLLKAFQHAEKKAGALLRESPGAPVSISEGQPIGDVYDQMEEAGVTAFCRLVQHKDDVSFFFLRGTDAILAVNEGLRLFGY
jgi:hypothetical protein